MIEILKVGNAGYKKVITCVECNSVYSYYPSDLDRYNKVKCPICGRDNWDDRGRPYSEEYISSTYKGEMECNFSK